MSASHSSSYLDNDSLGALSSCGEVKLVMIWGKYLLLICHMVFRKPACVHRGRIRAGNGDVEGDGPARQSEDGNASTYVCYASYLGSFGRDLC